MLHHRSHLNASAVIKSLPEAGVTFVVLRKADPTEDLGSKPVSQFPGRLEENPIDRYTRYRGLRQVTALINLSVFRIRIQLNPDPAKNLDSDPNYFLTPKFQKINYFFRSLKLSLHPSKTKFMIFTNNTALKHLDLKIYLNNNNFDQNNPDLLIPIEQINSLLNFLAFSSTLNSTLSFTFHTLLQKYLKHCTLFEIQKIFCLNGG